MITKQFLKQLILSQLGASQQDVELSDEDLDFIIYRAINYYGRHSSDAWNEEWTVIRLEQGKNYHPVPEDIDFIIELQAMDGSGRMGQVLIPETFGQAYEITMLGMIKNDNELTKIKNPVGSRVLYKNGKRLLQTDFAPDQDMNVAARVMMYKDLEPIYGDAWLQKYALGLAKYNLGLIRSKYSSVSAPNDTSMNGSELMSQAQTELERYERELFDESVIPNGGIIMG